jgi:hypothetical protein
MTNSQADPYDWIDQSLATIHQANWYRSPKSMTSPPGPVIEIDGQSLINFASNDYLGLATDPRLKQAAITAVQEWGTGSTGSRLLSGHRPIHQALENAIAELEESTVAVAAPVKTGGGKKSGKKRGGRTQTTTSSNGSNDGIQPDPRWATQLAQLKEMLAAANS